MQACQPLIDAIGRFHDAASVCLYTILRLQDFVIQYHQASQVARDAVHADAVYSEYLLPLFRGLEKIAGEKGETPGTQSIFERMTAARLALGRETLRFRNMQAPTAVELGIGMAFFFVRLWNRRIHPESALPIPDITDGKVALYAPAPSTDIKPFISEAHQVLQDYHIQPLHAELAFERGKAIALLESERRPKRKASGRRRPKWDAVRRELCFDGKICKKYRQPAKNQQMVLAAFQEEKWPPRIDDPLPGDSEKDVRQRLADTVRGLNEGNELLVFELDGSSEGILWKPKTP